MKEKKRGICLVQQEKEMSVRERILGLFILLLYFYMGVFGCVFGFLNVFAVPCDIRMLGSCVLAMGIFFLIICLSGKYAKFIVLLTCLTYAWMVFRNLDRLQAGGSVALEVIRRVASAYQNGGIASLGDLSVFGKEAFVLLAAVIFPWAGILFSGFVFRSGRLFIVMSMAIVLSAALAVGQVPDFRAVCLMIGGLVGVFSTDGLEHMDGQKAGTLLTVAASALLMAAGSAYLAPALEPWFEDAAQVKARIQQGSLMQEINERLSGWNTTWAAAGVGNGELGIADYVSSTNQKVLKVTVDQKPEEMIYLRCFTGANYTGKKWTELEEAMSGEAEKEYFESFRMAAEQNGVLQPCRMELQLQEDAGAYDYQPYDSKLEKKEDGEISYSYYPRVLLGKWDLRMPNQLYENKYPGFVYGSYTSYSEEELPRLREACNSYIPEDLEDLCRFIREYLEENAVYNLSVGRFPEDEDFAEYFLFEKHEGYCVHFATAATLMFRMYGLSARYVTGYAVSPKDFKKDGAKYSAWVKDSRAHAWTEIYYENKGWMPIEVTPGYSQSGEASLETERQTETQRQQQSEKQKESETDTQKKKEENKQGTAVWILCLLFGGGALVLAVTGRRRWILKRRQEEGVKELFHNVCSVLALAGFTEEADCQEQEFLESALASFPWLEREAFVSLIDLAVRANFAKEPVTGDEKQFARDMYRRICREVYRDLPAGKKAAFRWWYVYA